MKRILVIMQTMFAIIEKETNRLGDAAETAGEPDDSQIWDAWAYMVDAETDLRIAITCVEDAIRDNMADRNLKLAISLINDIKKSMQFAQGILEWINFDHEEFKDEQRREYFNDIFDDRTDFERATQRKVMGC